MNYPFGKKSTFSRFVSITLVALLFATMLGGCSLLPSKTTEPSTEPSTEPPTVNQPNIVEDPTTEPTTVATEPPTTEAKKENVAIVKEQMNIRSSPSSGSRVVTQVDAGDELEVLRIEPIGTVNWAYISSDALNIMGWVVTDMLDMSNVTLSYGNNSTPANTESNNIVEATQPTTGGNVDSITGVGEGTTPANSQTGTVNTNQLNIRASASINGERVGSYTFGDRITILETSNGWGRTNKGWVSMNYVTLGTAPTTGGNATGGTGNATITGSGVNVRSGAGTDYPVVASAQKGESVTILETTNAGGKQWGRTAKGWVCMDYVSVTGAIGNNTPAGGNAPTGNATVTGTGLNIRSGAGTNYAIVGSLAQGQTVNVLETVNVGGSRWGRINQGWICLDYVRMS